MRCWVLFFAAAKAVELNHIPPMPDIDQISTDEVETKQTDFTFPVTAFHSPATGLSNHCVLCNCRLEN